MWDLTKVSYNQKSFDLRKYFYLNFLNLENYLIWTDITDSKPILRWDPANAYFWILGLPPGCLEKSFQMMIENGGWQKKNYRFAHKKLMDSAKKNYEKVSQKC